MAIADTNTNTTERSTMSNYYTESDEKAEARADARDEAYEMRRDANLIHGDEPQCPNCGESDEFYITEHSTGDGWHEPHYTETVATCCGEPV